MYNFSVILPALNEGRWLLDTVDSALGSAADATEVEVICVDDHSDDFSGLDVALAYSNDERVKVVSGLERLGVGQARHLGALCSSGRRLLFVDAHSEFPERWDEDISKAFDLCGDEVLYGTALYPLEGDEHSSVAYGVRYDTLDLNEHYYPHRDNTTNPYTVMALPGGSFAVDREYYFELGGFDPGLMPPWGQENMELCLRAWMTGGEVRIIPSVIISTRYKAGDQANPGIKQQYLLYNRLRIAFLYMPREKVEKVMNEMRHLDWFAEAVAILFYDRWTSVIDRAVEWQRDPGEVMERFKIDWWD